MLPRVSTNPPLLCLTGGPREPRAQPCVLQRLVATAPSQLRDFFVTLVCESWLWIDGELGTGGPPTTCPCSNWRSTFSGSSLWISWTGWSGSLMDVAASARWTQDGLVGGSDSRLF